MELKRILPEEAKELLDSDQGYTYLDVRSQDEFEDGHAPGAVNIPVAHKNPEGPGMLPNPDFVAQVSEKFGKDDKIIVACLRGGRSMKAAGMMIKNGFTGVIDMRGGYDGELDRMGNLVVPGWARAGLPTTTD